MSAYLTAKLFNWDFPVDAIHNFKWMKIIHIWQNWGLILLMDVTCDLKHVITCLKACE